MRQPEVDARPLGRGHYSLLVDGRSYEVFVREEKGRHVVLVNGHPVSIPVESRREKEPVGGDGPAVVASPMPGRVIGIKVKEGEAIRAGQGLVIVEAMKMENELQAPRAGKVDKILVRVGEAVEAGQELVIIGE